MVLLFFIFCLEDSDLGKNKPSHEVALSSAAVAQDSKFNLSILLNYQNVLEKLVLKSLTMRFLRQN